MKSRFEVNQNYEAVILALYVTWTYYRHLIKKMDDEVNTMVIQEEPDEGLTSLLALEDASGGRSFTPSNYLTHDDSMPAAASPSKKRSAESPAEIDASPTRRKVGGLSPMAPPPRTVSMVTGEIIDMPAAAILSTEDLEDPEENSKHAEIPKEIEEEEKRKEDAITYHQACKLEEMFVNQMYDSYHDTHSTKDGRRMLWMVIRLQQVSASTYSMRSTASQYIYSQREHAEKEVKFIMAADLARHLVNKTIQPSLELLTVIPHVPTYDIRAFNDLAVWIADAFFKLSMEKVKHIYDPLITVTNQVVDIHEFSYKL
jgi:hypothetical protein